MIVLCYKLTILQALKKKHSFCSTSPRRSSSPHFTVYNNDQASEILFKSRTNNLRLNDRRRFWNEPTTCDMCGAELEDLRHFMLWCPAYAQERVKSERLQQPYSEEEEDIIGQYLFENKLIEEAKRTLQAFWKVREKKMKGKEENLRVRQ